MKKLLSVILCLSLAVSLLIGVSSVSADEIIVELDGKKVEFDVKPKIIDGRTMVPLRKIFEEIGALVKWDNDTQTVSARKNKKTITLSIDSADLQIDKGDTDEEGNPIYETVTLEVPAQIVSGRTLVPARAISESFGLDVDWDEDNKKVIITSDDDEDDSWKENIGSINLDSMTYEGEGIEITNNQIKITQGGDFAVSGTLSDGNITISTKEKVKIRLSGAKITSSENPCIFVEDADKVYITLTDGTENYLIAKNSEDGAIYSKENLEIKGNGSLNIESSAGHGIKASDNLNIENGNITINATSDGIHINDTFNMTGGTVNIASVNDGIDCESIVNISAGTINIETNGTPIGNTQTTTETTEEVPRRGIWEMDEADVEFEKSTKGINAEWMMVISGGETNINSASHAIHCQDEIEITGGKFSLSSKYDKGISAHGNLTISGADTVI
ncbi:MAG: carbohydrate-binding domain-containing protein, partial [Clostridia bacterium]|nr:carbohydrate-binding domain-containing protein [Clostridia bacterium]